jgi:two-component system, OmpR family, sensor histidine kinase TctE
VLLRYLPRADALGVDLGAEGLDAPIAVRGDAGLIEGILNNLLDNALRYGRGKPPRITVILECTAPWTVLRVADNGPGMDAGLEETSDRDGPPLARRWVQGEQGHRLGQGAGLGLAIVARYVELMKGRVRIEETPGGGVTACVHLPLAGMEPNQNAPGIQPPTAPR